MTQQAIKIASETKTHTPGPWYVRQDSAGAWEVNVGPRDFDQCVAFMGPCKYIDGDAEANARLIAAAPDMLAILEVIVTHIEFGPERMPEWMVKSGYSRDAQKAYYKATGEMKP